MIERSPRGLGAVTTPALAALSLAALLGGAPALAAPSQRIQVTQNGDFVLLGNTLGQDCGPGVPAPVVGNVGACGSLTGDTSQDVYWQADAPGVGMATADNTVPSVSARSTAMLKLPAGATVTHAYLYWAASRLVPTVDTTVKLERPGVFLSNLNALTSYKTDYDGLYFSQSVADVTAIVQAQGPGAYRVGDVDIALLSDKSSESLFGGWWMVVLYTLPGAPLRNLTVLEGMDYVFPNVAVNAMISGFTIPAAMEDELKPEPPITRETSHVNEQGELLWREDHHSEPEEDFYPALYEPKESMHRENSDALQSLEPHSK